MFFDSTTLFRSSGFLRSEKTFNNGKTPNQFALIQACLVTTAFLMLDTNLYTLWWSYQTRMMDDRSRDDATALTVNVKWLFDHWSRKLVLQSLVSEWATRKSHAQSQSVHHDGNDDMLYHNMHKQERGHNRLFIGFLSHITLL